MKSLSKQTIVLIVLATAVVFVVGVFTIQNHTKPSIPAVENGEEQKNQGENEDGSINSNEVDVDENVMAMVEAYDVSDWQIYSNEELGFSVKIPPTFDINDPRVYEDKEWELKNICFPDNQNIQRYQNEGKVDIGPRLLCFRKGVSGDLDDLINRFENSSNHFVKYNILISKSILAKLYFGFGSGIIFEFGEYRLTIIDSRSFNSDTVFDDVSDLYYLGIIKTFTFLDEEVSGM
jgi:hypothetical protein